MPLRNRGACVGDSGGPLLASDALARARVVGVLSKGSASCRGIDRYVLAYPAREWLDAAIRAACAESDGET